MRLDKEILRQKFLSDLNEIAIQLIQGCDLTYSKYSTNLNEPLLRWLDFRYRYIVPRPRQIIYSNKFPVAGLPKKDFNAFKSITYKIEIGEDVNSYQGSGITNGHDISSKKQQNRTDLLWADWGILHLHLNDEPFTGKYSKRADWLLFAMFGDDIVAFIDIRNHTEKPLFSKPDLIETAVRSWPEIFETYKLKGVLPENSKYTAEEIHKLRINGLSSAITIDDSLYFSPGHGITSASTPTKLTMILMNIRQHVRNLINEIVHPESQYVKMLSSKGISEPLFSLILNPKGLIIYEALSDIGFLPYKSEDSTNISSLAYISQAIFPDCFFHVLNTFTSPALPV